MARAIFPFFTTQWGDPRVPLSEKSLGKLLTSSNALWQSSNFINYLPTLQSRIKTQEWPFPGSVWYQMSLTYTGFITTALAARESWRDHFFLNTVWDGPDLRQLVVRPPDPTYVEVVPNPGQWLDLLDYMRWSNRRHELMAIYPQIYRLSLLNMSIYGPVFFIETDPLITAGQVSVWLTSMIGHDFRDIAFRLIQSVGNLPITRDTSYDDNIKALIAIFMMSYIGVVHQNRTMHGFYFQTKQRGTGLEAWTLQFNHVGQRVTPTIRHAGYFGVRSPDWHACAELLFVTALSSIRQAVRQTPVIANSSVIPAARDYPGVTAPVGENIGYFTLDVAATRCLDRWYNDDLISREERGVMICDKDHYFNHVHDEIEGVFREDNALMQIDPTHSRRLKPYAQQDWNIGASNVVIAQLSTFIV
ncbi:Sigma A [Mahlapitsi orthoreovirus]|uniref:Sigma A n=1 Tax=Mahlapitsi orthoreovirus TaxID=2170064 RepID=A0A3G1DHL4_9REOV|nr:Sigma A [Mahlapitsi orthoreovirus]AMU04177.1 Sigma A [Mahlapitsi orthoreovirus]